MTEEPKLLHDPIAQCWNIMQQHIWKITAERDDLARQLEALTTPEGLLIIADYIENHLTTYRDGSAEVSKTTVLMALAAARDAAKEG